MKKQLKKLNLNKSTITNLDAPEMNTKIGGKKTMACGSGWGHKTHYSCGACGPF